MSNDILQTVTNNEKVILINSFYNKEIRESVCELDLNLFLSPFSKSLYKSLKYFKPFLDKQEELDFDNLALQMKSHNEDITANTLKDVFEVVEKKEYNKIKHSIFALRDNKIKISLLDGEESLIDKLKNECNKVYTSNNDNILKIYNKIGKELAKARNIEVLASPINVEKYEKVLDERINFEYKTYGIKELDKACTYGAGGGLITATVGRPSHGKSLVSAKIATGIAESGLSREFDSDNDKRIKPYSSLYLIEMKEESYLDRKVSSLTNIPIRNFTQNFYGDPHNIKNTLLQSVKGLANNPYFNISDKGGLSYTDLFDDIKRTQDLIKQDYLVVTADLFTKLTDFFGLDLSSPMIAEQIGAKLQDDVKALGIHFNLVAQINRTGAFNGKLREPADLENYYPKIEHIKNMGMIEEICDTIFTVNRPKKLALEHGCDFVDEVEDVIDITIPKQRGGETGIKISLGFEEHTTSLYSLDTSNVKQIKDLDALEIETLMEAGSIVSDSAEF